MDNKQISFEYLTEVLPKKWAAIIAEKHQCSESLVYKVLRGDRTRLDILQSIIELAGAHKKKIEELHQRAAAI